MLIVSATMDTVKAEQKLLALIRALRPENIDRMVEKVARRTQRALIQETPKKWTGQTRAGWDSQRIEPGFWLVANPLPVMGFLEYGTKAHGPKVKKKLFIPLTARAANATQGNVKYARMRVRVTAKVSPHLTGTRPIRLTSTQNRSVILQVSSYVRNGQNRTKVSRFVYGRDYILTDRVRGIAARGIAKRQNEISQVWLREGAQELITKAVAGL